MGTISHSIRSLLDAIKCQGVSLYLLSLTLPLFRIVKTGIPICRAEQGDILPLKYLFMNVLAFSIKMSCDICDAWPGTEAGGSGVPQGAELGPLTLAPSWCQLWFWQLWLSASWFRSTISGWGRKRYKKNSLCHYSLWLKGEQSYERNSSGVLEMCIFASLLKVRWEN